ncbi:MAG TPA: T9SS type A sorting domain-containing protein [Eudoraea sp.]|nr:T9SS type A sorting domain-containing protein [Eudoraea sp.]
MKTKLHLSLWVIILTLGFNFVTLCAKTTDPVIPSQKTLSTLVYEAPIDPIPTEVSFTLIDASNNRAIPGFDPIAEGTEINLYALPKFLSIRANVPVHYESVRFDYDGEAGFRVENFEPYALFGDLKGDYNPGTFSSGSHTLSASPFSQDNAGGASGNKGILHFSIVKRSVSFSLVDADTDQDLFTIDNGMVIDLNSINDKNLNIRTNHDRPLDGLSVRFSINSLDGVISRIWTEHVFPYSIFGDIKGDFNGVQLPEGSYHILAVFDYGDDPGFEVEPSIELNFSIQDIEIKVNSFTIFAPTPYLAEGQEFNDSGLVFPPSSLPLTIRAVTRGEVGSVKIEINGPITSSRIENVSPYSLFGDSGGIFASRLFPEGEYELAATPFREPDGQGMAGKTLTVTFSIGIDDNYFLNGAGLVDAESLNFLDELLSADDGNLTLRNLVDNATVVLDYDCKNGPCPGSVFMALNGPVTSSRIENELPFSLFGDQNGDFVGQTLLTGDYTLTFTPFTQDNGMGTAGRTTSADFSIVDAFFQKRANAILFPNPARESIVLKTDKKNDHSGSAVIFDDLGREVKRVPNFDPGQEKSIDVSELTIGIYFIQIQLGNEWVTKKFVVN